VGGALVWSGVIAAAASFPFGGISATIQASTIAPVIAENAPLVTGLLPDEFKGVSGLLERVPGIGGGGSSDSTDGEPLVTLKELVIRTASAGEIVLAATVAIENPSPVDGTLKRLEYELLFLDAGTPYKMGGGALTDISLAPRKTTDLELVVSLNPSEVTGASGLVERLAQGDLVSFLVRGQAIVEVLGQQVGMTFETIIRAKL
jgi:hypothetical protein